MCPPRPRRGTPMNTAPRLSRRLLLALLPLCLAFAGGATAGSHEVALHGPNGNGGDCDRPAAAPPEAASPKPVPTNPPKRSHRIKPVVTVRSGDSDDSSASTPRWHSFLPGMFR